MRWGERLEFVAEAHAGDFIFRAPLRAHQEINALCATPLECVLVRSDNESVVVNLNIEAAELIPRKSTGSTPCTSDCSSRVGTTASASALRSARQTLDQYRPIVQRIVKCVDADSLIQSM